MDYPLGYVRWTEGRNLQSFVDLLASGKVDVKPLITHRFAIGAIVLAFIPLTHSVFWGSMAYTLIGGTAVGTVLILLFLPALYAAWFRIKPTAKAVPESTDAIGETRMLKAAE